MQLETWILKIGPFLADFNYLCINNAINRAAVAELVRASTIRFSNRNSKVPSSNPAMATDFRMMTDLSVCVGLPQY